MKPFNVVCGLGLIAVVSLGLMLAGCENDHSLRGDEFYLSPATYKFAKTNDYVVSIGVHGAVLPVKWSVSDPSLGKITGVSGSNAVFVSAANYVREPGQSGINTVIVRDARNWQAITTISVPEGL